MTKLLLKIFLRSKGLMSGLLILFVAGLISLHIGKHFLDKNKEIIEKTAHYQQESIARNVEFHPKEIGLLLYYVRFGLVNQIPNLAGLAIGQRDINPSLQSVTIRNLEEQKYATDLMNPMFQMLGNMDFSFVLIYFFPLIIIAFCFNLISEEKEEGTWSLVLSQSNNPLKMLRLKILIRYFSVLLVLILLLIIAKFYMEIPFDSAFLAFILISILYITFWFALAWLVASFHKNSSQNALILLISWVTLTIVVPAGINAVTVNLYPVPEAFSTVLESRDGYHNKWDVPKEPTVAKFHKHYPQFSQFKHPEAKDYSWLWYYAMQQMGDDEAVTESLNFKEKLKKRNALSSTAGMFFPSIHAQLSLNALSLSDMDNYLNFIEKLENFHEQKRLYFYPKIFNEAAVSNENWKRFGLEFYQEKPSNNWIKMLLPLVLTIVILLIISKIIATNSRII
ncbi:NosY ABC-type transport system involved in multi-copper enzyme maturation, permease component [Spirosomataceae bacterium]|jgi:ABC-2 type transport system permease protein